MEINRVWVMPSKWTFSMKPVQRLISKYLDQQKKWIDPFSGLYSPANITNDIELRNAKYHMDGLDFLKSFGDKSVDGILFDPPYSVEQCLRRYTPKFKGTAGRAEYWARCKDEIGRIVKNNGVTVCFSWDSCGVGKKRGFVIIEILLLCHGACHNDTIITVERKQL